MPGEPERLARTVRSLGDTGGDWVKDKPKTENFGNPDLESERVIEQQEGIVAAKGPLKDSDRPEPNVPHPEDLSMMDNAKTKGR
jgi:hypothetical protein